jgi:hypothetical protein
VDAIRAILIFHQSKDTVVQLKIKAEVKAAIIA